MTRVMAQFGLDQIRPRIEGLADVELVQVPSDGEVPEGIEGEVLYGTPLWSPTLGTLLERGVKWFHVSGTGVERLPVEVLEGRIVTCGRGVGAIPIAEFCLASIFAAAKQFPDTWLSAPSERHNFADFDEVDGQTLGIIGLGGIGTALATRALALGMRVVGVRRSDKPGPEGVEVRSLDEMLPLADHIVVAAPATPKTRRILDADAFDRCKPGVHVINIARGSLIDQEALLRALDDGTVGRASLDVTEPEPLPASHPLYAHPKAFVSAHVSWSSPRAFDRMVEAFTDNLTRYLQGQELLGIVDPAEGY